MNTENISGTVIKAIDLLEVFLQKDGEFRLTELAEMTGMDKATTYRLVSTLVKRSFLHQARKNGKYSLGLKMIDCSFAIRRNLKYINLAYLYLGRLNASQSAAVNLTIIDGDRSLVIEEIGISSKGLPAYPTIPKRLPLHATACGKIFLAAMTADQRNEFYNRNYLKAFTGNTLTDVFRLEKELETVTKEGVAYDHEDYKTGLWAIAAPIYDRSDKIIASVSIIVPPIRNDKENVRQLTIALKNCATELSGAIRRLG